MEEKMPVLFIGHGSPMNAIEDNEFTRYWKEIANKIKKPKAILVVSAHWLTSINLITSSDHPKTIHDFYGFPNELFNIEYRAPGSHDLVNKVKELVGDNIIRDDFNWGFDHGCWSILNVMYPKADIPTVQLSINNNLSMLEHFNLGKKLSSLRNEGILIIGGGNIVHNLRQIDFNNPQNVFDWAKDFNDFVKENVLNNNIEKLLNYKSEISSSLSVPTSEHFIPLIYSLGSANGDKAEIFNDKIYMGSISMTCFKFG